jgi:hypothetical protein
VKCPFKSKYIFTQSRFIQREFNYKDFSLSLCIQCESQRFFYKLTEPLFQRKPVEVFRRVETILNGIYFRTLFLSEIKIVRNLQVMYINDAVWFVNCARLFASWQLNFHQHLINNRGIFVKDFVDSFLKYKFCENAAIYIIRRFEPRSGCFISFANYKQVLSRYCIP